MFPSAGTLRDVDGNSYQTIKIGDQEWSAQNIRTTKLNDGTPLELVKDDTQWVSTTPSYCFHSNDKGAFEERFGALYNWYVVATQKIAPPGWHVATEADWAILESNLIKAGHNWDKSTTGNKLAKALTTQTNDWPLETTMGLAGSDFLKNNTSGFSAFPSGGRGGGLGNFVHLDEDAYWWTGTESSDTQAIRRNIFGAKEHLNKATSNKTAGMSIRLVRN